MSDAVQSRWENLAGRYGLAGQPEWRKLLTHFDLSEGFALIVLLTLDADGADLCRHELVKHLHSQGKQFLSIELDSPEALRQLPGHFLDTRFSSMDVCLWVAAVEPDYAPAYAEWRSAWQEALARLNAFRNPIREKFPLTIVFVGAPWLQEVMREIAPDLWSVRTLVVRIEPLQNFAENLTPHTSTLLPGGDSNGGGDPLYALKEADKLRGVPGKELALANLLHRAGDGFAGLQDWGSALKAYTESLKLKDFYNAPPPSFLDTLIQLGGAQFTIGHLQEAITLLEQALQISRKIDDRFLEAAMLGNLGSAYLDLGTTQKAFELANESLQVAREIKNRKFEGDALGILGNAWLNLGNVHEAIKLFEQQLAIAREIKSRSDEASAMGNLGRAYASLGDFHKSVDFCEQALRLARNTGNYRFESILFSNLGNTYRGLGQAQKAIQFYSQALARARQIGNKKAENGVLGNLGNAYRALGNPRKAIECHEQSLAYARESGYRFGEGVNLANLGMAYVDLGDTSKALQFFEQAIVIAREIGDQRLEANSLWNSALALEKLNDHTQAIQRAEAALKVFQVIEDPNAIKVQEQLTKWRQAKM